MVGALVKTGVVGEIAQSAIEITGGDALSTTMLILGVSVPVSGIIDNIPYVATMTPIVSELAASLPDGTDPNVLWWALALGADFGGNLTAVGASANVVMLGIAKRSGNPISFWEFTRKGFVVTAMSAAPVGAIPVAALLRFRVGRPPLNVSSGYRRNMTGRRIA